MYKHCVYPVLRKMMKAFLILGCLPILEVFGVYRLPPYIQVCKRQTDMFPCLKKNADTCKPYMAEGIPEFYLPPMHPLVVPKITIPLGEFSMVVTNATFLGMENFQLLEMVFNLVDNFTLHAKLRLPFLDTAGAYIAKGKLLSFDLDGSGMGTGNISDVVATVDIRGKKVMRGGLEYVEIEDGKVSLQFNGPVFVYFHNLFGDREDLTVATNQIIQDNIKDIMKTLGPFLGNVIIAIMMGIMKPMFRRFSLDELFPK